MAECEAPPVPANPRQLLVSTEGSFIPLVNGQWRGVKSLAIGEPATLWNEKKWESQVGANNITFFTHN
ncbi:MAG: hypothetical protein R3248_07490 [Candidatus Promineifilaceae bacterium]|nr:hypothetical protein [Candidatus Promineifilaceae bacterium]